MSKKESVISIISNATISKDNKYRYSLSRIWNVKLPRVLFIMLNPSTADDAKNDPTISKCMSYAKSWGYGGIFVGNLFAYRSTDLKALYKVDDPIGIDCDTYLEMMALDSKIIISAWGNHGGFMGRDKQIWNMFPILYCLDTTISGYPKHPLYLSLKLKPIEFQNKIRGL